MKRIGIDTETYLINSEQGIVAPRMVCLTFCTEDAEVGLLARGEALSFMHALLDADDIVFVAHHARFDFAVLAAADATLLPKIFRAYDEGRVRCTMVREKLLALARGELADEGETGAKRNVKFSLAACILRRFNIDLSDAKVAKGGVQPWRLRFSELDGIPVDAWPEEARKYALDDAAYNLALFDAQNVERHEQGATGDRIPDEEYQTRAAFMLYLMSMRGVRTDPQRVNRLDAALRAEYGRINALVRAADVLRPKMQKGEMVWTKNMSALRSRVIDAYGGEQNAPKTETGAISTARDDLLTLADPKVLKWIEDVEQQVMKAREENGAGPLSDEEAASLTMELAFAAGEEHGYTGSQVYNWLVLHAVAERSGVEKLLKTYVPVLLQGTQFPVTPTFNELVASGRTSCVAKGSLVEVVRNTSEHPEGIPIEEVREGDLVYAFDDAGGLVVKPVLWAGKTGTRKVVRLHWKAQGGRSSGILDLTDDHLVKMLGGWRKAGDILPGDRVYALRRGVRSGYWHLYATGQKEYREHNFLFSTLMGDAEHVHHKDGNKLNNALGNLEGMRAHEHARVHNTGVVRTPEQIEKVRQGNIRSWQENREYRMQAARSRSIQKTKQEVEEALWAHHGKPVFAAKTLGVDYSTMQRLMREHDIDFKAVADSFNTHGERVDAEFVARWRMEFSGETGTRPAFRQLLPKIGMNWYKWRAAQERHGFVPHNHVITKVEHLDAEVDVYDLTVADVHNFIANEICVHNCINPNLQNPPRKGGIRECFVPRRGYYYAFCDYSFIELCTLAQSCLEMFGWSEMANAINAGLDPHLDMAASMLGIPYEEASALKKQKDPEIAEYRQLSKCFHPDTDVLTQTGWKRIGDLATGEAVASAEPSYGGGIALAWQVPSQVFSKPGPGSLIHLKNEGIDLRVTDDHRMLAFCNARGKVGSPKVVMPEEMGSVRHWPNAGILDAGALDLDENLLRLAVVTQADGNYPVNGRQIRFGFTKQRKIDRLLGLLTTHGGDSFTITTTSQGATQIVIHAELADKVRRLLDRKMFPVEWLDLTPACREVVLDEVPHWDGHVRENWTMWKYTSALKQNVEVLQALATLSGRKTRVTVRPAVGNHAEQHEISVKQQHLTRGGNLSVERIPYEGEVVCLSVASSYVVVRDGGVPVITGQCLNFGYPGGLGAAKFVEYARVGYGVILSETQAKRRKDEWYKKWPEMRLYHQYFGQMALGNAKFTVVQPGSGRVRGGCFYTAACNTIFQGRAADGAKRAGWYIAKECYLKDPYRDGSGPTALYGARPVLFVHDEFILEVPIATAHEATLRLSDVMIAGMREVVPDVKVGTEYAIATRWYKGAEAAYDENKRLVPWEPKPKK